MVVGYTDIWAVQRGRPRGGWFQEHRPLGASLDSTVLSWPSHCAADLWPRRSVPSHAIICFLECCSIQKSLHKMHKGKESEMPPKFSCSVRDFSVLDSYTLQSYRFLDLIGGVFWGQVRKPRLTKSGHGFLVGICFTTASPHIHFLTSHRNKCLAQGV